jgi:hypothetical protein
MPAEYVIWLDPRAADGCSAEIARVYSPRCRKAVALQHAGHQAHPPRPSMCPDRVQASPKAGNYFLLSSTPQHEIGSVKDQLEKLRSAWLVN